MQKKQWTNEEIQEYRKEHGSFFYFNRADSNLMVPKSFGIGRTFNFANPIAWAFTILIAAVIVYKLYFR